MMNMPAVDGVDPLDVKAKLDAATTKEAIDKINQEILDKKAEQKLQEAKDKAKKELQEAGINNDKVLAKIDAAKTPEEVEEIKNKLLKEFKDSHTTLDDYNLKNAKEEAIKELKEAGINNDKVLAKIDAAKTPEEVEEIKNKLLKEFKDGHTTIDEFNLQEAKEEAIKELKEAGITSELLLDQIRKAKTIEGVKALKKEILKSHEDFKPKTTLDEWILAQNEKDGYLTKEDAIAAAKLALENDPINRSYKVRQAANGNWYFVLSPVIEEPEVEEPEEEKPEDKKKQTLDEWQIEQNEKDGYFTEEDARRAGELALEKAGLEGLYKVEVRKNAVGDMWFWRFVPVEAAEEEKPSIPWTPLTPAEEIKPGTPWTPIVPGETDKPGQDEDDKVVVPEEDEKDKDSKDKDSKDKEKESKEDKEKEDSKDKEKSKEKSKPAKTKGNNPKTGLAGLAPIYSTLAISMAGIVAARKKND